MSDDLAKTLADQGVSEDIISKVTEAVAGGEPINTIRLGPKGQIAHRVKMNGLIVWQIQSPTGDSYIDGSPTLPTDWVKVEVAQ